MAQSVGYMCDVCGTFKAAAKNSSSIQMPDGWIAIRPQATHFPSANVDPIQVCGNRCLAVLGKDRWEAENEGRKFSFSVRSGAGTHRAVTEETRQKDRERSARYRAEKKAQVNVTN